MRRRFSIAKGKLIAEIKKPDYEVRGVPMRGAQLSYALTAMRRVVKSNPAVRYIVLYYYTTSIASLERGDPWDPPWIRHWKDSFHTIGIRSDGM